MTRRLTALAAAVALVGALAACSADEPEIASTPTAATSAPTETSEIDVTDQLAAGDAVTRAYELEGEPDRVSIETTITDPRGEEGSPEAQQAIEICETARAGGYTNVSVYEADGTTFVLAGHPTYGEECAEV